MMFAMIDLFIFLWLNLWIKNFHESGNMILGKSSLYKKYQNVDTEPLYLILNKVFTAYGWGWTVQALAFSWTSRNLTQIRAGSEY